MIMKNLYKILELETFESDIRSIKNNYSILIKEANKENNLIKLNDIEYAYSVLNNREKKEKYDNQFRSNTINIDIKHPDPYKIPTTKVKNYSTLKTILIIILIFGICEIIM